MDDRTQHTVSGEQSQLIASPMYQQPRGEEFPDLAPGLVMSTYRSRQVWSGMAWRRAFAGRGDQSAAARRMVGQLLADTGRVEDAKWVTAELVSNALNHTRSGQARGFFVVEVLRGVAVARIVVYDLGGGQAPDFTRTRGSVPEVAEHGRGLAGVVELAVRVGAAGDAVTGHAVWAELALTGEPGQPVSAGEAAWVGLAGAVSSGSHELVSGSTRVIAMRAGCAAAGIGSASMGCEVSAGDMPDNLSDGLMVAVSRRGSVGGVEVVGLDPSVGLREAEVRQGAGQVSAFGQEPWAQRALAGLRRDWPDWAFLVVRYRWLAMRGKQVVISATGPQELRQALPSIPPKPNSTGPNATEPLSGSGSVASGLIEGGVPEPGPGLPTVAEQLSAEPGVSWARVSGSRGGAGVGLSGTVAAGAPPSGAVAALAAERSGTGTWAVPATDRARVAWWLHGWSLWPWRKRRDRSRSAGHVGRQDRLAGRDESVGGHRHRRVRSKPTAAVVAVAVAA
ncbi:ATP-binding protein [Nonomuraea sp. NPDC049625]|uniref:ATP-binding protein n=1 Tax=Nonomuraea sp. NPDC049625 TaxID=3155775 RepID=UPI0034439E25